MFAASQCLTCVHKRDVVSGTGSRFLLCQRSLADKAFPKYPGQPVIRCSGYEEQKRDDTSR